MINIKSSETLVFWPTRICAAFFEEPGNAALSGDTNFKVELEFKLNNFTGERGTIFSINPDLFVLHYYNEKDSAIHMSTNGNLKHNIHQDIRNIIKLNTKHILSIHNVPGLSFSSYIDNIKILDIQNYNIAKDPQILIGSEILDLSMQIENACDMDLYEFKLYKDNSLISHHNFNKFIHNKSIDLTGNCNFIHKI